MKKVLAAIFLIIAVNYSAPARAEDAIGESLDWLVVSRPSIAIEEVVSTIPIDSTELTIQTKLKKSLKGRPPQQTSFTRHWLATAIAGHEDTARPTNGTEYLLFFNEQGQVTNAINLQYPSHRLGIGADPRDVAISIDYAVYQTRDSILEIVDRRLKQITGNNQNVSATSIKSRQMTVPLDTPAWNALYDGGICYLLVPDNRQEVVVRVIAFSAPVNERDCADVSRKPFELKSVVAEQRHTLTIGCEKTDDALPAAPYKLSIVFKIVDVAKQGDYEFRWGENSDLLPQHESVFPLEAPCYDRMRVLFSKLPPQMDVVSSSLNDKPMVAKWHADCVPDNRWGTSMAIYLNIGSKSAQ